MLRVLVVVLAMVELPAEVEIPIKLIYGLRAAMMMASISS